MTKPSLNFALFLGGAFLCPCSSASAQTHENLAPLMPLQTTLFSLEDTPLPGWDVGCAGTIGHYLSACAQMAHSISPAACSSAALKKLEIHN